MIEEFFVVSTGLTTYVDPDKSPDLYARLMDHPLEYKRIVDEKVPSDTISRKAAKSHDSSGSGTGSGSSD